MQDCDFGQFSSDLFRNLANLEQLLISHPFNYSHFDFSHLVNLKNLYFGCVYSSIKELLTSVNSKLFVLNIIYCFDYSELESSLEVIQRFENHHVLKMHMSEGKSLNMKWFTSSLSGLKSLQFALCDLGHIISAVDQPHSFHQLKCLIKLNLSSNKLTELDGDIFLQTPQLEKLDLSSNRISVVTQDMFRHLKNLKWLDLSINLIETLEKNISNLDFVFFRNF